MQLIRFPIILFFAIIIGRAAQAEEIVELTALARVGNGTSKVTLTTRDLQLFLFISEQDRMLQDYAEKKDPVKELVWEQLIYDEAKKIISQDVTEPQIRDYAENFKKKLAQDKMFLDLHFSNKEIREAVQRRMTAKRMLHLKMGERELIHVSDEEIESYYIQNRNQLGQKQISEVKDKIKMGLQTQKARERFRDWIEAITRTQGVVYYSGYKIQ